MREALLGVTHPCPEGSWRKGRDWERAEALGGSLGGEQLWGQASGGKDLRTSETDDMSLGGLRGCGREKGGTRQPGTLA